MNRKILGIAFLSGVLLCGLGSGIAFAQYSKLEYAGERRLGEENIVSETLESTIEGNGKIYLEAYTYWNRIKVEPDESVPVNKIIFDVSYNSERVSMGIEKSVRNDERDYYTKVVVNEDGEILGTYENSEDNNPEDTSRQGEVFHIGRYKYYDDARDFFEAKDIFLSDLKKGKIGTYKVVYMENVTVRINPANYDRVQWYY